MESLPLELIVEIGTYLSLGDRTRFRLTCWTYYPLFPDPLAHLAADLSHHQRQYYYKVLDHWERYLVAADLSINKPDRQLVAMTLAKRLNRSVTVLGTPQFGRNSSFRVSGQKVGITDIYMPWLSQMDRDKWKQRLRQKDVIIWEYPPLLNFLSQPKIYGLIHEASLNQCPILIWFDPHHRCALP